jgi:hypothetical protein
LVASALQAVEGLIIAVPAFISAWLKPILETCLKSPKGTGDDKADKARASLSAVVTKKVPTKPLLTAIMNLWTEVKGSGGEVCYSNLFRVKFNADYSTIQTISAFAQLLSRSIASAKNDNVAESSKEIFEFLLDAFEFEASVLMSKVSFSLLRFMSRLEVLSILCEGLCSG